MSKKRYYISKKERSGLTNTRDTGYRANDSDYGAGGSGLLGSKMSESLKEWNKFFGVKYNNDDYDFGGYDDARSNGAFKDWYNKLTDFEKQAVATYTGGSYSTINGYLRGVDGNKKYPPFSQAPQWVKDAVKGFDSAVKKFNLTEAITVWRGGSSKLIGGSKTVAELNDMKGTIVTDKGITSTAVTTGGTFSGFVYKIVYPAGTGRGAFVDPISSCHGEQEFTAARNTDYEVLGGYKDSKGNTVCMLKAVYGKKIHKNT